MTLSSATNGWTRRLTLAILGLLVALPALPAFADDDEEEPTACFTLSDSAPDSGETVTFNSSCSQPSASIVTRVWDLDNDGSFDDGGELTAARSFSTGGTYTVRLRVTHSNGERDTTSRTVSVQNRPPVASFAIDKPSPLTLEQVTFTSTSTDPDGTISSRNWDLDNDGAFDDLSGGTATRTFPTPGNYAVRLRVVDNRGASDIESVVVTVRNRAPSASFTRTPLSPLSRTSATFNSGASDLDGTLTSQTWDFDNDGSYDDGNGTSVPYTFNTSGDHVVKLRVEDNSGAVTIATSTVTVGNRAPSAAFSQGPSSPLSLESVTFTSGASDLDGTVDQQAWDLDNDGQFDDGDDASASREFPRPGAYTVRLQVVDNLGAPTIATRTVTIGNRAPTAGFSFGPSAPLSEEEITFSSAAGDLDGTVDQQAWDLDDDGQFDDATGSSAKGAFPAGDHRVSLQVMDDSGAVATDSQVVSVAARPAPPDTGQGGQGGSAADNFDDSSPVGQVPDPGPITNPVDRLRSILPFPIVRIRGRTDSRGADVSLLNVKAPAGVRVTLRCRGGDCPSKRATRRVTVAGTRPIGIARFRRFETHLRAGTLIEIFATQPGRVGKYTRFEIRKLLAPRRRDRCVMPGALRAASCPEAP